MCAKHYKRTRRHGDANTVLKRGRKPSEFSMANRALHPEQSPRTQARIARATRLAGWLRDKGDGDYVEKVLNTLERPNGTWSIARELELLEARVQYVLTRG